MRAWVPLGQRRLRAVIKDTERDYPVGIYTEDDIYRLAREVERWRASGKRPRAKGKG